VFPVDLLLIIVLSIILLPLALITTGVLRIILGLLFILFFPGYSLLAALFSTKFALRRIELVALSFGLSIAIVALIGLALNYTPWGISLTPILVSLFLFILIMSIVAWYRRRKLPSDKRFTLDIRLHIASLSRRWTSQRPLDKIIAVILVVSIASAIGILGYVMATPQIGEKYTEFYILGVNGKAEGYPQDLTLGQEGVVIVGIINHEQQNTTYHVTVKIEGTLDRETEPVSLKDQEKWEKKVAFKPGSAGADQKVEFLLYKNSDSEPSDNLHLWINVKPSGVSSR
jgi:uncharacterized membrane protein